MSCSVFVSGMVVGVPKLSLSSSAHGRLEPTTKKKTKSSSIKFITSFRTSSSNSGAKRVFHVTASDNRSEQADNGQGTQEDLSYLLKLGAGSMAGAAIIKYGSVLFPEITTPNLTQALFIIISPVVISVILLFLSSSSKNSTKS